MIRIKNTGYNWVVPDTDFRPDTRLNINCILFYKSYNVFFFNFFFFQFSTFFGLKQYSFHAHYIYNSVYTATGSPVSGQLEIRYIPRDKFKYSEHTVNVRTYNVDKFFGFTF